MDMLIRVLIAILIAYLVFALLLPLLAFVGIVLVVIKLLIGIGLIYWIFRGAAI